VLLRVGDSLWRRATDGSGAASMLQDGVVSVPPSPGARLTPLPPPLQLGRCRGGSSTQEEVCLARNAVWGSFGTACPAPGQALELADVDVEMGAAVVVEVRVRGPAPTGGGDAAAAGKAVGKPWPAGDAQPATAADVGSGEKQAHGQADKARVQPLLLGSPVPSPRTAAGRAPPPVAPSDGDDDGLCTICCDRAATCVFMECGHGGYCWRCAHVLYVRPPNECPVCRARIEMVLEVSDPAVPLGGRAPVRFDALGAAAGRGAAAVACLAGCLPCPGGQMQPVGGGSGRR
jgi:hypothetical protein